MPLESRSDGNIVIDESGRCLFLSKESRPKHTEQTYVSHFASCPGASKHRRAKP